MRTREQGTSKLIVRALLALVVALSFSSLFACAPAGDDEAKPEESSSEKPKTVEDDSDDDDVIVAGTVDTSSNYSFDVQGAFVGMDEYSEDAVVILVCEFTNNSDEVISYGSALDAEAFQSGYSLKTAYLRGAGDYTYEKIEPGKTISIFIGWKLVSASDDVEITVIDRYHYAKEVLFEGSFTIDELIENSKKFVDEYGGIVDENQNLTV